MQRKTPTGPPPSQLRLRAESLARRRRKTGAASPSGEADVRSLVHELQVHQIELEMQNEELFRSRAELESVLREYSALYDFAPVGYFTLDRAGSILRVNLMGASLLCVDRARLLKRRFASFLAPQSRRSFDAFLASVFQSPRKVACELAFPRKEDAPCWAQIEAVATDDRECRLVMLDTTARKLSEEALRHLSIHDTLTGLYNRGSFHDAMSRMERGRQYPISLVMGDVDGLKTTNDRKGHNAGDALLVRVAQVLTAVFRAEDVVARVGGDEFAVLLPGTGAEAAEEALHRLRQKLREHNAAHPGAPLRIAFGVSTAQRGASLAQVLKEADKNMYLAKRERAVRPGRSPRAKRRPRAGTSP